MIAGKRARELAWAWCADTDNPVTSKPSGITHNGTHYMIGCDKSACIAVELDAPYRVRLERDNLFVSKTAEWLFMDRRMRLPYADPKHFQHFNYDLVRLGKAHIQYKYYARLVVLPGLRVSTNYGTMEFALKSGETVRGPWPVLFTFDGGRAMVMQVKL